MRKIIYLLRFGFYREARDNAVDAMAMRIAWMLPRRLVMWCFFRVLAHATTGQYGNTVVPDLTAMDAVERWYTDHAPQSAANVRAAAC